ncbi:hypothetical protein QUB10_00070 [Microcoleus sp. B5-D4]|uniref:hypothetical protein n=1 Tax=unclassified Microcoleus TaxID=2642155 RepID=UPI002FD447C1
MDLLEASLRITRPTLERDDLVDLSMRENPSEEQVQSELERSAKIHEKLSELANIALLRLPDCKKVFPGCCPEYNAIIELTTKLLENSQYNYDGRLKYLDVLIKKPELITRFLNKPVSS